MFFFWFYVALKLYAVKYGDSCLYRIWNILHNYIDLHWSLSEKHDNSYSFGNILYVNFWKHHYVRQQTIAQRYLNTHSVNGISFHFDNRMSGYRSSTWNIFVERILLKIQKKIVSVYLIWNLLLWIWILGHFRCVLLHTVCQIWCILTRTRGPRNLIPTDLSDHIILSPL